MQFLSNIMLEALKFFSYFGGYGWGIVWLTIAVNLALYPLTLSSISSMAALQRVQPRIQELQKKYKDKPQELQKEMMGLYKAEKVNPLGGCLPVLLKIPFFLALFWALQSSAFLQIASNPEKNTGFLWVNGRVAATEFKSEGLVSKLENSKLIIPDKQKSLKAGQNYYVWDAVLKIDDKHLRDVLANNNENNVEDREKLKKKLSGVVGNLSDKEAGDVIAAWNNTNNLAKPDRVDTPIGRISILALLIGITTYLMQKSMPTAGAQQAQMMSMFMPIFIVFICWNFPTGVQIYWLVSNVVGAAQQYYILKRPKKTRPKKRPKTNEKLASGV
jgi:YidC/Oxa1 family membrane protein insertase